MKTIKEIDNDIKLCNKLIEYNNKLKNDMIEKVKLIQREMEKKKNES